MEHKYQTPWGYAMWDIALSQIEVELLADGILPLLIQPEHLQVFRNCWPEPNQARTD